ncbi:unnamed protein product [Linum trigynum]|uniref:Reverse transcriptase zinc-binding domain-containing protein n=1 Tax=Linum trigynum TaxID=586398 RepID=A0AAV2EQP4_9ROSI
MDILSFIIDKLKEAGLLTGFRIDETNRRGAVTHLLYADDAIIFCDDREEEVLNILAALVCFQCITGLRVNLSKTRIFPVGDVPNISRLSQVLGCDWEFLPTTYLGLPLGAPVFSSAIWNPVISKLRNRLESWKGSFLSLGGRVVLINAVLSSQSTYSCSLFPAPKGVVNAMEKIQRDFLWSGSMDKEKIHLISWDVCKIPKQKGGLGIRDLETHNHSLLLKWLWRFSSERESWWRELICLKFPSASSEWSSGDCVGSAGCSPWSQILKLKHTFWKMARIEQGSGCWTSFWHDHWVEGPCLAEKFPRVMAAAVFPSSRVADHLSSVGGNILWDIPLKFTLRGGAERERECLMNLLEIIPSINFTAGPERVTWLPDASAGFSVKSAYDHLRADRHFGVEDFPFKVVWQKIIPSKICTFLWIVFHKRLLTRDNLKKRGIQLPSRCPLCEKAEENPNHLFINCSFSKEVWWRMRSFVRIASTTVDNDDISTRIMRWFCQNPSSPWQWCTKVFLHAFCWSIWMERNSRVFKGEAVFPQVTAFRTGCLIASWVSAAGKVDKQVVEAWVLTLKSKLIPRS